MTQDHKELVKIPVFHNTGPFPDLVSPIEFLTRPEEMFEKLKKLNTEIFRFKMGLDPWYVLTGKDAVSFYGQLTANEIDVFEFRKRMFTLDMPGSSMPTDILNVSRATNENLKLFFEKVDQYELTEIFVATINRYLEEKMSGDEGVIEDLSRFIIGIATAGIVTTFIGKEIYPTLPKDLSDYYYAVDESLRLSRLLFPLASSRTARKLDAIKLKLASMYLQLLNERKNNPIPLQRPNLFDGYLEIQKLFNLPDNNVVWVYNAMQWSSIHYPAVHGALTGIDIISRPSLLADLQKEQSQFDVLDWEAVSNMQLLGGSVRENIRLNSIFALPRRVIKDLYYKNYLIPKGAAVVISPYLENQNANVYVNPRQYNPYRWPKNKDDIVYSSFIPGGVGPFSCLGMNFAIHFLTTMWAILLRNYELNFAAGVPKIHKNFIPIAPHKPVKILYRKRR